MAKVNWLDLLEWKEEQIDDVRAAGYAYIRQGKYDIALSFFEALSVLLPQSAYDAQTLGAIYLQLNQPAKALRFFDRALKLQPNHLPTLLNLSKAFFMLGNKEEGLRVARLIRRGKDKQLASMAEALILVFG